MLFDTQSLFSDSQLITITANSSNVIDQGPNAMTGLIGQTSQGALFVRCMQTFAGGTSLAISLVSADDAALSSNLITHWNSGPIALASLTAKSMLAATRIPPQRLRRYLGVIYTVVGTMTAGSVLAGIAEDLPSVMTTDQFAKGFSV
ncbi:hypothetical protein B0G81_6237 [Paraburkholderia sp. BL6665CI2N2]|uniref:Bbp16 family capsid cement protein n=1 Tax=Paraburkholderia sp. BL6665CI2N2 TaxID=1938806 RepID=UPI001065DF8F|nr:hypothetical protein [Paraburkholderia sp. BL6665CI2N2]TDY25754.1 hypothetical protein B0G81_6237 [Paraburkholderia sp. BL6665CI2N2]